MHFTHSTKAVILLLISLILTACATTQNLVKTSYESKLAMIKNDLAAIEKAGFLWADATMKEGESYISKALDEANAALGCDTRLIKIIAKTSLDKADRIEQTCNYVAGLKKIKIAEKYAKANKKQMKTQQFALPTYEKKRN